MRAVIVEHRGESGALRTVPDLTPADNEILVKISVAGVNPVDWKVRDVYGHPMPFTLGQDFAGTVVATGAKVRGYAIGERVFGIARERGAYAEFTTVPENDTAQPVCGIPATVADAEAAGLPTPALTALACIERIALAPGKRVAILGITGAVGHYAAQIARDRGLLVAGSGKAAHAAIAFAAGADVYIAYDTEDVPKALRAHFADGVDAIVDLVDDTAGTEAVAAALVPGGTIVSTIRAIDEAKLRALGYDAANVNLDETPQSSHAALRTIAHLVEHGTITVPIVAERPLVDAVAALDLVKSGGIAGKVIVTV
jgi:NADPH:quinone reductase-like Zn-dependent oxidoreductase